METLCSATSSGCSSASMEAGSEHDLPAAAESCEGLAAAAQPCMQSNSTGRHIHHKSRVRIRRGLPRDKVTLLYRKSRPVAELFPPAGLRLSWEDLNFDRATFLTASSNGALCAEILSDNDSPADDSADEADCPVWPDWFPPGREQTGEPASGRYAESGS